MRSKKFLWGVCVMFMVFCLGSFSMMGRAEQSIEGRIEKLEKEVNDLRALVSYLRIVYIYRVTLMEVKVDGRDFVQSGEYGGPDLRVLVCLNNVPMLDLVGPDDTYEASGEAFKGVTSNISKTFYFRGTDKLEVWLMDRNVAKDYVIAHWVVSNPMMLRKLVTLNGSYVCFEVGLLREVRVIRKVIGVGVVPVEQGLKVVSVLPGFPADRAGVRQGDIISEVNSKPVRREEELVDALEDTLLGESVVLTVMRLGETMRVVVCPIWDFESLGGFK